MRYYSTNDQTHQATLEEAVLKGRADDGGLYLPEHIPVLPQAFVSNLQAMSLQEMSYAVANYALQGDVEASVLHNIVYDSLNFPIPLVYVGGNRFALELFHGPTMSFKDVGMRFMARMVSYFTKQHHQEINVLVTTSGNTGGAVASGFYGMPGVNVYILYPQDTLSPLQEAQFTTLGGNVTALEVNGTLDDCREMVAEAFSDKELNERMHLTSARTINMARLLPQVFYYFFAFAQLAEREQNIDQLVFAVPCGNLGNLTAGVMARQMGLPVKRFIAADNCNDIFTQYLATGDFVPRKVTPSVAPAMDIGNPQNFAQLHAMLHSHVEACELIDGVACDDKQIMSTIAHVWQQEHYLLDPQSATAYRALLEHLQPGETGVALATAHPAKYRDTVEQATGETLRVPGTLSRFLGGTRHVTQLKSGYTSFRQFLLSRDHNNNNR